MEQKLRFGEGLGQLAVLKWYFVTIIALTYCEKNLFKYDFEFFQGKSQKHYKFMAFGLKFAKLFLASVLIMTLLTNVCICVCSFVNLSLQ